MASDYTTTYKSWQCPPAAAKEDTILGWQDEAVEEGMAWLKSQRSYGDFRAALDTISGKDVVLTTASYRSQINPNRLKRNIREIISVMSQLRPFWGYQSDNKAYQSQAEMMNKVARAWYLESMADTKVKEALQWASVTARGWLRPIYRRNMYGTGHGDIALLSYGSESVLPFQLPSNGDWQSAYAVSILEEFPIAMAHGMFPEKQNVIKPTSSRYWYASDTVRKGSQLNLMQRIFGKMGARRPDSEGLSEHLVPIRYQWIIDLTINTTGMQIPMGEPGSSWFYQVPYVGQDLFVGNDPRSGTALYRKADENDARLYPRRRLLISTPDALLYDGPAFDWHGMFPAVSFSMDAWPWEPLGFSLVHDGYMLNEGIKEIVRGNMDKVRATNNLPLGYDTNAVAMKEARAFDPMKPRDRVGYDGSAVDGFPFKTPVDPAVYEITEGSLKLLQYLETAMDAQFAIKDAMALAQARLVGSMDSLEKIMEMSGPLISDMSRSMEPPMRDLGVMVKYLILQFYTTPRVMQIVGPDGITPEVFDYDPSSLVPSHLAGESPERPSAYSKLERAKIFADNLRFFILPNSLHELTQTMMKLGLVQLRKAGVMIDSQTIAEAWGLPNYGSIEGNTVIERWQNEEKMKLMFAAAMKELAGAVGLGAPPGAAAPGKPNPEGRPPSGNAPPELKSKDHGTRSTITESQ